MFEYIRANDGKIVINASEKKSFAQRIPCTCDSNSKFVVAHTPSRPQLEQRQCDGLTTAAAAAAGEGVSQMNDNL